MSREHELASLAEREKAIREALGRPGGVTRPEPGHYVAYYSRAELQEELGEIADERARLRPRQSRRAPATAAEGRTSNRPGHPARPVQNRRNPLIKSLAGAVVIGADVLCGMAAPESFRTLRLHHATQSHLYGAYAFYGVLALLTLWVVMSAIRALSPAPKAAPRPGYQFRGGQ